MHWRSGFILLVVVGIFAIDLVACGEDKSKDSSEEGSDSSEEAKDGGAIREKRSDEEIMFGNQQNKASNGAVDELLTKEDEDKKSDKANDTVDKKDSDDSKLEDAAKDDKEVKKEDEDSSVEEKRNVDMIPPDPSSDMLSSRWFGNDSPSDASSDALQYILNTRPMQSMGPANNFVDVSGVFDQSDLYRRKRQSVIGSSNRPVSLRKRSLRSPIGQMIRTRRLPRRSMRLKRQVDVEQLLSMIRNAESNNDNGFYKPGSDRYTTGSVFRHHDLPYPYDNLENTRNELEEDDSMENKDFAEALVYPPPSSSGYFNIPEYAVPNNRYQQVKETENPEVLPRWMDTSDRISPSSIFSVARRSTPLFYPVDYRFIPGYKKRSNMIDENDLDDVVPPAAAALNYGGKWGRVVDSPGAYASAEDVARLYALANLLAENENGEIRVRRSA